MEEQPGLSDQYRRSSPWPLFVALGFVLSEFGVLFGGPFIPVAVAGVVLLEWSVVGILRESQYATTVFVPAFAVGVLFTAAGTLLFYWGLRIRAIAVTSAGVLALLGAVALWLRETGRF